jgi:RimJ/RimL family protein N-acetyltransferase
MNFNFEEDIILENAMLLLRPVTIADIDNLMPVALADKTLLQFSPKQIHSPALLAEYIKTAIQLRKDHVRYTFSLFNKEAGCYAGSTAFLNISNADDRLEIGATWIDKKFHGTGLNGQGKHLLLHYAFNILNAHRVEFRTDERNSQSRKAIEKTGGKFEGILREHTVMYDGYRRNTCCYSILKHEWKPTT